LLDNIETWNEDDMDRCGYFIEAKGLHAGLKVNDKEEFPDLCINEDLPDIDSPSYKNNILNQEMPIVGNNVID